MWHYRCADTVHRRRRRRKFLLNGRLMMRVRVAIFLLPAWRYIISPLPQLPVLVVYIRYKVWVIRRQLQSIIVCLRV